MWTGFPRGHNNCALFESRHGPAPSADDDDDDDDDDVMMMMVDCRKVTSYDAYELAFFFFLYGGFFFF